MTPTNLHRRICFISERAYQKDGQYSTADNQRACYSKRRWQYNNVSRAKYLLLQ